MTIDNLKNSLADHAKDIKLNLSQVHSEDNTIDFQQKQIFFIATVATYSLKNTFLHDCILQDATEFLSPTEINAAKAAATIMAMNNIYYRSMNSLSD